ncbi:TIGR03620 family F420-dependent LLM class oxidoreductase [Planosporangium flavigriseum]|uniref:LLM class F420-dependent oxidoreductase n=1 Tax=Planosporangium flavigriseum TaxID=373681 RepID=A0A8J3LNV8_9ACTN|nr:TIGR03620 family F420-dependent LLM class oxidoreductase [Planosporangium flavigriseum]NJC67013.1 TIGR03620 family F420-dependent LLM class oxidoreductase [Planosporangium flavigriseum]GIG73918.1 LLM class F420-dependent oxidoreductase [Planosporangium flavigriseum]
MAASEIVSATRERLGPVGTWLGVLRGEPAATQRAVAHRVEKLGYGSLWEGERVGANDVFVDQAVWLCTTERLLTGAGIANIWARHPAAMQVAAASLEAAWPGRTVLGIGVSHAPAVARTGQVYERPLERMRAYLDGMDLASVDRPRPPRVLAALRPRMLELARDRADGAHTYFVPPGHTRRARQILGPDKLVIPEQAVYLATDAAQARAVAREHTSFYLGLPNYVNNLRQLGFGDSDFVDGGSDELVDAIVAWGDVEEIEARVRAHLDEGADHVLIQPLGEGVDVVMWQLEALALAVLPA